MRKSPSIWIHLTFCHATVWLYRSPNLLCNEVKKFATWTFLLKPWKFASIWMRRRQFCGWRWCGRYFPGNKRGGSSRLDMLYKRWHSERLRPKVIQIRQVHLWELNISNPNQKSKYQALTLLIQVWLAIGCLLEHLDNEMKETQGKEPLGRKWQLQPQEFAARSPKILHWFATGFVLIVYLWPSS